MTELVDAVLRTVRVERTIELGAKGKPWDDDALWAAYIRARHNRQVAVDAWLKTQPDEPVEAETMALAL